MQIWACNSYHPTSPLSYHRAQSFKIQLLDHHIHDAGLMLSSLILGAASTVLVAQGTANRTVIPKTCFDSVADFENSFGYLYSWGSDHNGAARMDKDHIKISGGVLNLTASPVAGQMPASPGGKSIDIHYLSGTVYGERGIK
jgi:galactan endo-beta-1,3-galactanase